MSANQSGGSIRTFTVTLSGIGRVPSFKNAKRIWKTKNGKLFLGTRGDVKKWMKSAILSIESQLRSECQTADRGISTELQVLSSIALLPPDDNWKVIPEIHVKAVQCANGDEGATIVIELLPNDYQAKEDS